jgi:ribosomal protein S18 acetylase RimI-like enzyme
MTSAGRTHYTLSYRKAQPREMDWAYQIFKSGMQAYITRTWGWNELFQEHSFFANLPASSFVIASINAGDASAGVPRQVDIGGYCLKTKTDHLYLEMLLIDPAWQRRGFGSAIMDKVMAEAGRRKLAVRLSVLKINPAYRFYQHLGFTIEAEDNIRYRMIRAA